MLRRNHAAVCQRKTEAKLFPSMASAPAAAKGSWRVRRGGRLDMFWKLIVVWPTVPKAWENLSAFQSAYNLGKLEAGAAFNLMNSIDAQMGERLMQCAQYLA